MNLKALTRAYRSEHESLTHWMRTLRKQRAAFPAASAALREALSPADLTGLFCSMSGDTVYAYTNVSGVPGLKSRMAMRRHMRLLDNGWEPAPYLDSDEVIDGKPARTYGYRRSVGDGMTLILKLRLIVKGDSKSCRVVEEVITHTRETKVARVICA